MQRLGQGFRELVDHGAECVLLLGVTHGEHRGEDTLDMPYLLQALGHLFKAFGHQGLHIFTQGGVSIPQRQEGAHIIEGEPGRLRRANETDNLQSVFGIEAIIIARTSCRRKQPSSLVVTECGEGNPSRARELANIVVPVHSALPRNTQHPCSVYLYERSLDLTQSGEIFISPRLC